MQAIILVAGRGARLRPITNHIPKPMIKIMGQNSLERNIAVLPPKIDEVVLVVGYMKEQIINHFGDEYLGRKITYIKQKKLFGTGHALHACKEKLKSKFLVMMGDDLYSKEDIARCLGHKNCLLAREIYGKFVGGRIILDSSRNLNEIREGIHNRKISLVNTGLYVLTDDFFKYDLVRLKDKKEYGLPQTLVKMARDHQIKIERAQNWLQISDLAGLKRVERILAKKVKSHI